LRALRSDLIDPTIAVHKGRVVKRTGDGLLVEFRSTQSAVTGSRSLMRQGRKLFGCRRFRVPAFSARSFGT
jgi:class 3 adenylate cyclase